MRVGTWNLQRGGRRGAAYRAQARVLDALKLDVVVLTEPPAQFLSHPGIVTSPANRAGPLGPEAWVAIAASGVELVGVGYPFERLAVAARCHIDHRDVIVYGSVLPWMAAPRQAPDLAVPGESAAAMFERVLIAQTASVASLQQAFPDALTVWAGDFNQPLVGPNAGFTAHRRTALTAALADLGLVAWNGDAAHARETYCAIDLICGPASQAVKGIELINPVVEGRRLSDHAGYVVELDTDTS